MIMLLKSKSKIPVITLLFCIFILFYFCTVCYSAFSSTMNIDGVGFSRVEADVRITDFSISDTTNSSISMYESFGKDFISSEVSLKSNSSITYNLEITNYGTVDAGIYSISGLPEGLNYSIEGYNLKDKICDENGKCNSFVVANYKLVIYTGDNSYTGNFTLNFDFRGFHNISYIDMNGTYIDGVIDGDSIEINLSSEEIFILNVSGDSDVDYYFLDGILYLNNVTCDIVIENIYKTIYDYSYTGNVQEFVVPVDGIYKVELWGASGGDGTDLNVYYNGSNMTFGQKGGYGGYTSGEIELRKGQKFYVYVGEMGKRSKLVSFNGGGSGGIGGKYYNGTAAEDLAFAGNSGGGATDIRLVSGSWNSFDGLKSRIMVAAGGGGATTPDYSSSGGLSYGGGLTGYSGGYYSGHDSNGQNGQPGSQTSGGLKGYNYAGSSGEVYSGSFGIGGSTFSLSSNVGAGGGGGGYYGGSGAGGTLSGGTGQGGGGGSSFVSGHNGCNAVLEASGSGIVYHAGKVLHYTGLSFSNTKIIDGAGYNWTTSKGSYTGMPSYTGESTIKGNLGNGHAKISLLEKIENYDVTYVNISGNYPTSVSKGQDLVIDFESNAPLLVSVFIDDKETNNYTYNNSVLTINNINGNVRIESGSYKFSYTGNYQVFVVPYDGIYKVELWGASGNTGGYYNTYDFKDRSYLVDSVGGYGSYVSGQIELNKDQILYVYVGEMGNRLRTISFNGGGTGGPGRTGGTGSLSTAEMLSGNSGGGATDIRLVAGNWDNFDSLKSRIIVAAGGGGTAHSDYSTAGGLSYGGGLTGYTGGYYSGHTYVNQNGKGGTQTSGGAAASPHFSSTGTINAGGFGYGGSTAANSSNSGAGGGGGGYYGGGGASGTLSGGAGQGGGSGSSFISGHSGCDAISDSSTSTLIVHTGQSVHYSNYIFTNTKMIDGAGYNWTTSKGSKTNMPTHDGLSTMTGNVGNGYAKITLLEFK